MSMAETATLTDGVRGWVSRWSPLLPVLVAEFVVLAGFGALLPVLPLYLVRQGVDSAMLGVVIAGWPIAKLIAEPIFGYLADRQPRRPLMLVALLLLAVGTFLPVVLTSVPALFAARLLSGAASGMYDPAARGIIFDATTEERRGEAFGLYGSFQMGGIILGPVIGAATAAVFGAFTTPFVLTSGLILLSAIYLFVALRTPAGPAHHDHGAAQVPAAALAPGGEELTAALVADAAVAAVADRRAGRSRGLRAFAHPLFLAAIVMQLVFSFSTGAYEVVWSLFMERLGASLEWIGLTFTLFGIPIVLLSPIAGRLIDRVGGLRFAIAGGAAVAVAGIVYTLATEPLLPTLVGLAEGCGFAFATPGLFWLLARGTPEGRTSTAQGIFGAASTAGFLVAALLAGGLWGVDYRYPFYLLSIVTSVGMLAGWLIARGRTGRVAVARAPV
jgi:MFS family permease